MHIACMATKTVSLSMEAYLRLRSARRHRGESFSQVILRAEWPERTVTGRELLARLAATPPVLPESALDAIDAAKARQRPPEDKWIRQ